MDIKYIRSEENPAGIMTKNCSEYNHIKHMKIITEGELPELVIIESWMESLIVTQLNNPVMHPTIPWTIQMGVSGYC